MTNIKLVAPIKPYEEYNSIIQSGADEFYLGIIPDYWKKQYGSIGLNRRDFSSCNLSTFDELITIIKLAHKINKKVSITLNNHYYTPEQFQLLSRYIDDCISSGIDSFIIADPSIALLIRNQNKKIPLHISSEAGCYSGHDILFFNQFGIDRIIFPRDVTIQEIYEAIEIAKLPIQYEVFIFGPRCTYSGAYCTVSHGIINGPSFCSFKLRHEIFRFDGIKISDKEYEKIKTNYKDRNYWANSINEYGNRIETCGICSIKLLNNIGVKYFKIVGREFSLKENLESINLISNHIRQLNEIDQQIMIDRNNNCNQGFSCYYVNKKTIKFQNIVNIKSNNISIDYCNSTSKRKKVIEYALLINKFTGDDNDFLEVIKRSTIKINSLKHFNNKNNIQFSRLYFGNEYCQNKIPSIFEIKNIIKICNDNNILLSLLFPPLSSVGIRKAIHIFNCIDFPLSTEIICNSWGLLHLLKDLPSIKIVLGRLLNKIKHDPFISVDFNKSILNYKQKYSYNDANDKLIELYLSQSNVNNNYFNEILSKYKIERIETDIPYQVFKKNGLKRSLYYPFQYVTLGRYCFWSSLDIDNKRFKFKVNLPCEKICEYYFSKIETFNKDINLYNVGNTIFSHQLYNIPNNFDRFIFEETLPM